MLGVRADGNWITWRAQATGAGTHFNELWAAPYAETPPLTPRRLWTDLMTSGRNGTIGDGMFACDGWDATAMRYAMFAVRLSDGARYEYTLPYDTSPTGVAYGLATDPAWVTRDELVFPAGRTAGTDRLQTVLRIDLRSLTPEPLP